MGKIEGGLVGLLKKIWVIILKAMRLAGFKRMGDVITFRIFKDHSGFCQKKIEQK